MTTTTQSSTGELALQIAAYEKMQSELEEKYMGKWVVFYEQRLAGIYDSFAEAAADAVARFGRGPYLVRQVGSPPVTLPASVMFRPNYG